MNVIHVYDGQQIHLHGGSFEEQKHPRAKSGKTAGQFVKKGSGATSSGLIPKFEKVLSAAGYRPEKDEPGVWLNRRTYKSVIVKPSGKWVKKDEYGSTEASGVGLESLAPALKHLNVNSGAWSGRYKALLKVAPEPTYDEIAAIKRYSSAGYKRINNSLRRGLPLGGDTKKISEYLKKARWPETSVVYRRVSRSFVNKLLDHKPETFSDAAFSSSSTLSDVWIGIGELIHITIPKGSKAAAIGYYSFSPYEQEVLIQAGAKYRVDKIDRDRYGDPVIKVTLVETKGPGRAHR